MEGKFDAIAGKAKEMLDFVGKKTDEVVTSSKAKLKIVSLNGQIKDAYTRLGNSVYDAKKNGLQNDDLVALIVSEIDELISERKVVEASLEENKQIFSQQFDTENYASPSVVTPQDAGVVPSTEETIETGFSEFDDSSL